MFPNTGKSFSGLNT